MKRVFLVCLLLMLCAISLAGSAETITLEDVLEIGEGWFIRTGNEFCEVLECIERSEIFERVRSNECIYEGVCTKESPESYILTIDRSQQQLIYTSQHHSYNSFGLMPIRDTQYCYPVVFWYSSYSNVFRPTYILTRDETCPVDVLEELPKNCTLVGLRDTRSYEVYCMMISNSSNTSVDVGHYSGTRWQEERLWLDALLFSIVPDQEEIVCTFERTQDGYFILDISDIPEGRYLFSNRVIDIVN